jgi:hypothetical protein
VVEPAKQIVVAKDLTALPPPAKIFVRESSEGPSAMEARFTCDACHESTIVYIAWNATAFKRSLKMKEALDLHRKICPVGLPEDMRVYQIHYPRG